MLRLLILAIAILLWPKPAHAYLDPGTGSYIVQVVIGVFAGAAYATKVYWRQILAVISRVASKKK